MTYTPNIPAASGDTLGGTRDRIRTNFQQISDVEEINHIAFNQTGKGKHKFLQMPETGFEFDNNVTPPTTSSSEVGFYAKKGANPAQTNLFFRGESNGFEYQLTKAISASTGTFSTNTAYVANHTGGWTFLPGGLLLQYGLRSSPGTSGTITFPISFNSAPYQVSVSLYRFTGDHSVIIDAGTPPGITSFKYICDTSGSTGIYWTAIGV